MVRHLSALPRRHGSTGFHIRTSAAASPADKSADDGKEDEHKVERVPALLHHVRPENVGGEGENRGQNEDYQEERSERQEHDEKAGAEEDGGRPAPAAPVAGGGWQPKWGGGFLFFLHGFACLFCLSAFGGVFAYIKQGIKKVLFYHGFDIFTIMCVAQWWHHVWGPFKISYFQNVEKHDFIIYKK